MNINRFLPNWCVSALLINIFTAVIFLVVFYEKTPHIFVLLGVTFCLSLIVSLSISGYFYRQSRREIDALYVGLLNFQDGDFSISLTLPPSLNTDWHRIFTAYNAAGDMLRTERQTIYQRELMLEHVMQSSPLAMVLTNDNGVTLYSNHAAWKMFDRESKFDGLSFPDIYATAPSEIQQAIVDQKDTLVCIEFGSEEEFFHVSHRQFVLNNHYHHLYLFKRLTRELNRQEVATWKKVIRVISHEINNSIAPLSSMAHSGKILSQDNEKLIMVFQAISERASHLNEFIQQYARFAKLPSPRLEKIHWSSFMEKLQQQMSFSCEMTEPDIDLYADASQLEQALINLIKNAEEAGSPTEDIVLSLRREENWICVQINDRGPGMSEQIMQNALVPFYSTKKSGTGLGLALCREIVEAHEGRMSLANRKDGGMAIRLFFPFLR